MGVKVILQALQDQADQALGAGRSAARDTRRTLADIGYSIRDRTSNRGFVPGMNPMFEAMRQAAANAGLARLEMTAGKGEGHLSHARGTEADFVGYNADGSRWTKAQRVAVAKGAATAGANRFGFYSGPTLHVGLGYPGSPHNVVWNNKLRGVPAVTSFAPEEQAFVNALRAGQPYASLGGGAPTGGAPAANPQVAALQQALNAQGARLAVDGILGPRTQAAMQLYGIVPATGFVSPPAPAQSLALQAVNTQANITRSGPEIARLQRDLNSLGANLTVDGLEGPLTRAAVDKYGTPITSKADVAAMQRELNAKGANLTVDGIVGPLTRAAVNQYGGGQPPTPQTPGFMNPYSMSTGNANATADAARAPRPRPPDASETPASRIAGAFDVSKSVKQLGNPYSGSTGGADALTPRRVPTTSVSGSPFPGVQLPSYSAGVTYPSAVEAGARAVPTASVPPRTAGWSPVGTAMLGGFAPGGLQAALQQKAIERRQQIGGATPYFMNPYSGTTGGTSALTARLPNPVPEMARAAAQARLMQQMQEEQRRQAAARAGYGGGGGSIGSYGGGYGGGYTGGSYGGYGGGSIGSGVGGAFRNR